MNLSKSPSVQGGFVTIFVAMILLILITLMVVMAYSLSTVNLKAVGNMQMREEATVAAEKLIEMTLDGTFWDPADPVSDTFNINGTNYNVDIVAPICLKAEPANITTTSSVTLPGFSSASAYNTVWLLDATSVADTMGARVRVRHGVRVLMSETDKDDYCLI
jgi:Tfp pilus assembly protein PilX